MASRSANEAAALRARAEAQRTTNRNLQRQAASGRPFVAGFPVPPVPPVGSVALSTDSGLLLVATLDGPPQRNTLDGGWETIDRDGNAKALDHTGDDLEAWVLPVLLGGFHGRVRQESAISTLYRMAAKVSRAQPPPKVRVGGIGPIPRTREWAITSIDGQAGDAPMTQWARDRTRHRARLDVTITDRVLPRLVKVKPARATRDRAGTKGKRTTVVRSGDTLQRIALRELGDASRWRDIARKNHIRDPNRPPVGKALKLP